MNCAEEGNAKEGVHANRKAEAPEEIEDEALQKINRKKKARLRTRGPYRKALIEKPRG